MEKHCLTYHGDETAIAHLALTKTQKEIIEIYKYFIFLTGLFRNSPLHQTINSDLHQILNEGNPIMKAVEEVMVDWQHEIIEIYQDVTCDVSEK
jgi:hypothetical protein